MESDNEHEMICQIVNGEVVISVPNLNLTVYLTEDGNIEQVVEEEEEEEEEEDDDEEDEEMEQDGGGPRYTIETVFQRNIPKFKVQGSEYRVTIAQMNDLNYREAVQVLHHTLDRTYFFSTIYFYILQK